MRTVFYAPRRGDTAMKVEDLDMPWPPVVGMSVVSGSKQYKVASVVLDMDERTVTVWLKDFT